MTRNRRAPTGPGRRLPVTVTILIAVFLAGPVACTGERPTFAEGPDATLPSVPPTEVPRPGTVLIEQWAENFCGAFRSWQDTTSDAGKELTTRVADTDDPEEVRSSLVDLLERIARDTEKLAKAVRDGTVPDIDGGEDLVEALADRFDDLAATFDGYATDARGIDADDPDTFQDQVDEVLRSMSDGQDRIAGSFEEIDRDFPDPRFQRALRRSCAVG